MPRNPVDPVESVISSPRPTLRQVAAIAGVSESTVSRALSQRSEHQVSAAKLVQVRAVAEKLGLRPGDLPDRPRRSIGRRQPVLGVIARDLSDTFFTFLAGAVIGEARKAGMQVLLGDANSRALQARALEEILETRRCEAIVLLGDVEDAGLLADIQETKLPVLGLCGGDRTKATDAERRDVHVPFLNSDNREGIFELLRHVTANGHERIAFVTCPWDADVLARCAAFVEFMKKRGLAIPRDYMMTVSNDPAGGVRAMSTLLELSSPPTAVMAGTDNMAMGCIQAAWSLGRGVPANVSVTGFDGLPMSSYLWPSLVTMRQEIEEIAYQGLRLLARAKAGEAIPAQLIPVPPKFVAGASVRSLVESDGLQTDK